MYEILNSRRKAGAELGMKLIAGFEIMTKNPMAVQTKVLLELLEENKDTEYGKKYAFGEIKSIEEYQAKVPVTEYDDYAEYIDRMSKKVRSTNPLSCPTTFGKRSAPRSSRCPREPQSSERSSKRALIPPSCRRYGRS